MSEKHEGQCWMDGPKHDWVPDGGDWLCDRCGEEIEGD